MDRSIIAPLEQMRDFDFVQFEHDVLCALGDLAKDCLSQFSATATGQTVIGGFAAVQTGPTPSLSISLGSGRIYVLAAADSTSTGSITSDSTIICQQGRNAGQLITLAPPSAGQSQWNLIQCQFSQVDAVRAGDPNSGIVPFFNAANPAQPNNASVNTVRLGEAVLQVITGSAATTGSEVPPSPTNGWVPLYLVDLAGGQTQITTGQILVAGPSVGTGVPGNYASAPFMAGFQASHHNGKAGQAPKIDLTKEVQGILPYANMSPVRQVLSGGLILYVNGSTGNDANGGQSPASAFKTIQAAVDSIYHNYDFNGNTCTINVANGTYSPTGVAGGFAVRMYGVPLGLNSPINIVGNTASPGSVTIAVTNGNAVQVGGATVNMQGFTITASGSVGSVGFGLVATLGANLTIGNMVFGSCGTIQLQAIQSIIAVTGPVTFTGTTPISMGSYYGSELFFNGATITVTGLTATAAFVLARRTGSVEAVSATFVGSAVGPRYLADTNGVIATNGAGANYLPGNSAGSTASGGQYV